MEQREHNRDMCADLLTIHWMDADGDSRNEVVTLEDISATGACIHLEQSISLDTEIALHYPEGKYLGRVKYCIYKEIGYILGIAFDDGYRWSKADFRPSHLLEIPQPEKYA